MNRELPKGWEIKKIKDFAEVITGGTPSTVVEEYWKNGTIPWLPSGDLKNCKITKANNFITKLGLDNSAAKIMSCKTVLIALTGATTGQTGLLEIEASANQSVTGILPSEQHIPEYLFYYLQTLRKRIMDLSYGGAQPHISQGFVKNIEVVLPPLSIQKKIVTILEKAEAIKKIRTQADELTNQLLQSVFLEIFGDPIKNPKKWDIKSFDYFAKIDTDMTIDFEKYASYPHIGIENIERDTGNLVNYKKVGEQKLTSGKYIFSKEHIIYSKIRPNLNKVALPSFDGLCSADSYPLLMNKEHTNKYFFTFILRSSSFLNYILKYSSRTNIPKVNKEQVKGFQCICPPKELQNRFQKIIKNTEKLKEKQQELREKGDELISVLMQKAFTGELVA